MEDVILKVQDICKYYPGVKALDGVSFEVKRGEVHAICGENGAGKSTFIKILTGAIEPTSGSIVFNGKTFDKLPDCCGKYFLRKRNQKGHLSGCGGYGGEGQGALQGDGRRSGRT